MKNETHTELKNEEEKKNTSHTHTELEELFLTEDIKKRQLFFGVVAGGFNFCDGFFSFFDFRAF